MTDEQLIKVLASSLENTFLPSSPENFERAHHKLEEELPQIPGYLPSLLLLAVEGSPGLSESMSLQVRKAASIMLRKEIESSWKPSPLSKHHFSELAKATVRDNIIEGMCKCSNIEIAKLLGTCVGKIAMRDYPQQWPDLEDRIYGLLKQNSDQFTYVALCCLAALGKARQYFIGDDRRFINITADRFLPVLCSLMKKLIMQVKEGTSLDPPVYFLSSGIFKNIYRLIMMDLPEVFKAETYESTLADFILAWIATSAKTELKIEAIRWKANVLKWLLKCLYKFSNKYCNPKVAADRIYAVDWSHGYSLGVWNGLLPLVSTAYSPQLMDSKIVSSLLRVMNSLLDHDYLFEQILEESNIKPLVRSLIPIMKVKDYEVKYFEENPEEFMIWNDEKVQGEAGVGRYFAILIFKKVFSQQATLQELISICSQILETADNEVNKTSVFEKEATYSIIQIVSQNMIEQNYSSSLRNLVFKYIVVELQNSSHPFLTVRLLCLLSNLTQVLLDDSSAKELFKLCFQLFEHKEPTVKLAALVCTERLLHFKSLVAEFNTSDATKFISLIIETIFNTESSSLLSNLWETLDTLFPLIPSSLPMILEGICRIFSKLIDHIFSLAVDDDDSKDIEERSEKISSARNCLHLIHDILKYRVSEKELASTAEGVLREIGVKVFACNDEELVPILFSIMNVVVFRTKSTLDGWLLDFLSVAIYCILPNTSSHKEPVVMHGSHNNPSILLLKSHPSCERMSEEVIRPVLAILFNYIVNLGQQVVHIQDCYEKHIIFAILEIAKTAIDDYLGTADEILAADAYTLLSILPFCCGESILPSVGAILNIIMKPLSSQTKSITAHWGAGLFISSLLASVSLKSIVLPLEVILALITDLPETPTFSLPLSIGLCRLLTQTAPDPQIIRLLARHIVSLHDNSIREELNNEEDPTIQIEVNGLSQGQLSTMDEEANLDSPASLASSTRDKHARLRALRLFNIYDHALLNNPYERINLRVLLEDTLSAIRASNPTSVDPFLSILGDSLYQRFKYAGSKLNE